MCRACAVPELHHIMKKMFAPLFLCCSRSVRRRGLCARLRQVLLAGFLSFSPPIVSQASHSSRPSLIMLVPHPRSFLSLLVLPLSLALSNHGEFTLEDGLASFSSDPVRFEKRALGQAWTGKTSIAFGGSSGVGAMCVRACTLGLPQSGEVSISDV